MGVSPAGAKGHFLFSAKGVVMSCYQVCSAFAVAGLMGGVSAQAAAPQKPAMEMHGYVHLKLTTAPALWDNFVSVDGKWDSLGREGNASMGWVRLAPTFNLANDARLVMEFESDVAGFRNGSEGGFSLDKGSAYLEMPVSPDTKVWFGRRRFEFNTQRWSDNKAINPSPDRLNGGGIETKVGDYDWATTVAIADHESVTAASVTAELKKLVFVQKVSTKLGSNAMVSPLVVVDYIGKNSLLDARRTEVYASTTSKAKSEADQRVNAQFGVDLTSWGEGWWNNVFTGVLVQNARAGTTTAAGEQDVGRSAKDYVLRVGTQGGYNALAQTNGVGLYYGGRVDVLSYKNDMQVLKIDNDVFVDDGSETTKQGLIAAVNVQPIYYFTEKLHGALDVTYTHRAMVKDGGTGNPSVAGFPSVFTVSPTLRFANKAEPIALPQIYVGASFQQFAAKHEWVKNAKDEMVKNVTTVHAGIEADF